MSLSSKLFFVFALFMSFALSGFSQSESRLKAESRHKTGFIYGYGNQNGLGVNYNYDVKFYLAQYNFTLITKTNWNLELSIQPQFNTVNFEHIPESEIFEKGYEYGLNGGFVYRRKHRNNAFNYYIGLTSGPHYVSGTPERQAPGFIFSDNLFVGISVKVYRDWYLDLRPNFRHISNASLKSPNWGVNSFGITGGFFVFL